MPHNCDTNTQYYIHTTPDICYSAFFYSTLKTCNLSVKSFEKAYGQKVGGAQAKTAAPPAPRYIPQPTRKFATGHKLE